MLRSGAQPAGAESWCVSASTYVVARRFLAMPRVPLTIARCFVAVSRAVATDAKSTKRSRADLSHDRWTQSPEF